MTMAARNSYYRFLKFLITVHRTINQFSFAYTQIMLLFFINIYVSLFICITLLLIGSAYYALIIYLCILSSFTYLVEQ